MASSVASYIRLHRTGELRKRAAAFKKIIKSCVLCPHMCRVNRTVESGSERGKCGSLPWLMVSSYNAHFGEEPPISGIRGSGTIFFTHCTGSCIFCQNYPISQIGNGRKVEESELASMMISLQRRGCHNINFVSPTHYLAHIISALDIAAGRGLTIPIVYNTGGYERAKIIKMLEGIVDIYMPDAKYSDSEVSSELSGFEGYPRYNSESLAEMHRQVGDLKVESGIAVKGLFVRHLVLPGGLAGTSEIMKFLASLSPGTYVSIMAQYFPAYKAVDHQLLGRRVTVKEYDDAIQSFHQAGLSQGYIQEYS